MANFAGVDYNLKINTVDMSLMCTKVTLKVSAADLETTAFGGTYRSRIGGLKDASLDVEFNQDFAASQVDALLWPLLGTVVAFELKPTSGAASATNPRYTGSVLITDYSPLDGSVGDLAKTSASWPTSGSVLRFTT